MLLECSSLTGNGYFLQIVSRLTDQIAILALTSYPLSLVYFSTPFMQHDGWARLTILLSAGVGSIAVMGAGLYSILREESGYGVGKGMKMGNS